jgi:hypothetical protein
MQNAKSNEIIERFIRFVERYRPSFGRAVRGATPDELRTFDELALQLTGNRLPSVYHAFLARAGGSQIRFWNSEDASLGVGDLIEFYRGLLEEGETPPPRSVIVGVGGHPYGELAIVCEPNACEDGGVFVADCDRLCERLSDSFEKWLFQRAFAHFAPTSLAYGEKYAGDARPHLARIAEWAAAQRFAPYDFSDSLNFCAERSDGAVVVATQLTGGGLALGVAASRLDALRSVVDPIRDELGLHVIGRRENAANEPPLRRL